MISLVDFFIVLKADNNVEEKIAKKEKVEIMKTKLCLFGNFDLLIMKMINFVLLYLQF